MAYFVTGATGFIGRFLVAELLEREGTIYVLCRASSLDKLDELRERLGADDDRIVPVIGDLAQGAARASSADDVERLNGKIEHFFHLAAIYDLTADADSQRVANVEGTRHALQLAEAVQAGHFHQVSSIAAAGLYTGTFTEDMFDEATDVDNNPYYATKHESERRRARGVEDPVAGLPSRHRGRQLRDRRDRQDRRPVLLLPHDPAAARRVAVVAARHRHRGRPDQHRARRLRRQGDGLPRAPARVWTAARSTSPIPSR